MKLIFYKYQGTGNDFVMVDNRDNSFSKNNTNLINKLCDRRFGIGADGLILLEMPDNELHDFKMIYYNADGNESSMCGNGGRCIVAFAKFLNIINSNCTFSAIDGVHEAVIDHEVISLKMNDVEASNLNENEVFLNTGSPHRIEFFDQIGDINVKKVGSAIRYSNTYAAQGGTNVNFVQQIDNDNFMVRTYERGVEDETYSCGTGVTAVAIAAHVFNKTEASSVNLETPGGKLKVSFNKEKDWYKNIWLTGPATYVFKGEIDADA